MTKKERRKEARYKIQVDVVTKDAVSMVAQAVDVSSSGMRIQAAETIPPDTQVVIFMPLKKEVSFRGTVVWAIESPTEGAPLYLMGIEVSVIGFPGAKAYEASDRKKLFKDILPWIDQQQQPAR